MTGPGGAGASSFAVEVWLPAAGTRMVSITLTGAGGVAELEFQIGGPTALLQEAHSDRDRFVWLENGQPIAAAVAQTHWGAEPDSSWYAYPNTTCRLHPGLVCWTNVSFVDGRKVVREWVTTGSDDHLYRWLAERFVTTIGADDPSAIVFPSTSLMRQALITGARPQTRPGSS